MRSRLAAALSTLFLAGLGSSRAAETWIARPDGIGPVKVGITLSRLNTILGENHSVPTDKFQQACFYVHSPAHPGTSFMVEHGRVSRIDVARRESPTAAGIRVGDSETRALEVYGSRLKVEPNPYTAPQGRYLTIYAPDGRYGMRFEAENGAIVSFYSGWVKEVEYIEGCN